MEEITNAKKRTNAKLRYARVHLEELRSHQRKGSGDDFERSHIESFLFHLFGALDAFLQELNLYYGCGLERLWDNITQPTAPSLRDPAP